MSDKIKKGLIYILAGWFIILVANKLAPIQSDLDLDKETIAETETSRQIQEAGERETEYCREHAIGYINQLKYDKEVEHYYLIILPEGQSDPKKMKIYIPSEMGYHEENSKMLEEYYIDKEVLLTFDIDCGELLEWQVLQP